VQPSQLSSEQFLVQETAVYPAAPLSLQKESGYQNVRTQPDDHEQAAFIYETIGSFTDTSLPETVQIPLQQGSGYQNVSTQQLPVAIIPTLSHSVATACILQQEPSYQNERAHQQPLATDSTLFPAALLSSQQESGYQNGRTQPGELPLVYEIPLSQIRINSQQDLGYQYGAGAHSQEQPLVYEIPLSQVRTNSQLDPGYQYGPGASFNPEFNAAYSCSTNTYGGAGKRNMYCTPFDLPQENSQMPELNSTPGYVDITNPKYADPFSLSLILGAKAALGWVPPAFERQVGFGADRNWVPSYAAHVDTESGM
jgi:hypothetical protein